MERKATRLCFLVMGSLAVSCGHGTVEALEAEAADCAVRPPLTLGDARQMRVLLNAYYLQEEATRALRSGLPESPPLEEVLTKAKALGVTAIRTWGFNDAAEKVGDTAIQIAPLTYDETSLRGLDMVLARAEAHGLKLILPLGNYWDAYGGTRRYAEWAHLPSPQEGDARFFTDRNLVEHYKAHLAQLLNRVSALDGKRYGDHPAILAWELLNEPRNTGLDARGDALYAWTDEVATHVKRLAPAQLVGTGEEGFDEAGEFRKNTASSAIDFGSIHFFPEAWGIHSHLVAALGARWISEHAEIARALGKPLLIGEFGLRNDGAFTLEERRALYRGWLLCARASGVGGAAPWMFAYDDRPDAWDAHTFYFRTGTLPSDAVNRYADLFMETH